MRNPNSLSSRNILLQEDGCAESRMSMRYARLRQRDLHHTGVNTTRRLLSDYDAICRHAPTRPLEGGKAGLRYCGRARGRIPFRVRRDSDLLLAPSWMLPADGTGNRAGRSWPGRRGYRKPICATVFATAAGSRARSPSCGQCEKSLKSSSICALAGRSAITSFADGAAKATGFSEPRMPHSRPSGGTAIAVQSWSTVLAILNSPDFAVCCRRIRASTTAKGPLSAQMHRAAPLLRPRSGGLSSHSNPDRGRDRKAVT